MNGTNLIYHGYQEFRFFFLSYVFQRVKYDDAIIIYWKNLVLKLWLFEVHNFPLIMYTQPACFHTDVLCGKDVATLILKLLTKIFEHYREGEEGSMHCFNKILTIVLNIPIHHNITIFKIFIVDSQITEK